MPSRNAKAPWCTVMVWATWRNRINSRRSRALGAQLILVDLGEPGVDGRVGRDQPVDVGEPEEAPNAVQHRVDRGRPQPALTEVADVQLDVGPLNPFERVQAIGLAPAEPPPKLVGVQAVGVARVPGQVGDRRLLRRRHRVGLERQQDGVRHGMLPGDLTTRPQPRIATHDGALD